MINQITRNFFKKSNLIYDKWKDLINEIHGMEKKSPLKLEIKSISLKKDGNKLLTVHVMKAKTSRYWWCGLCSSFFINTGMCDYVFMLWYPAVMFFMNHSAQFYSFIQLWIITYFPRSFIFVHIFLVLLLVLSALFVCFSLFVSYFL